MDPETVLKWVSVIIICTLIGSSALIVMYAMIKNVHNIFFDKKGDDD